MSRPTKKQLASDSADGRGGRPLNREFLFRLLRHGRPAKLGELFDGSAPVWAADAAIRCWQEGYVTRGQDDRYSLTEAGMAEAVAGKKEAEGYSEARASELVAAKKTGTGSGWGRF